MGDSSDLQFVTVHGHRRAFVKVGTGPAVLLLHGLACDHTTWSPVIDLLAKRFTVIAPDLLGHGRSAKPRADYSVGGYANGMRDLLTILGVDKATVVGHSLGGGVAMQFAYQFPERTERMALVAPGGLGPEVSLAIRAVTLPGFDLGLAALAAPGLRQLTTCSMRRLASIDVLQLGDLAEMADIVEGMRDPDARRALRHVLRGCVDLRGQVITMLDRAYLTRDLPLCAIWGQRDRVIPTRHSETLRAIAPAARVEVIPRSGHFPHKDQPELFARTLTAFIDSTEPATYRRARWRALLLAGSPDGQPGSQTDSLNLA